MLPFFLCALWVASAASHLILAALYMYVGVAVAQRLRFKRSLLFASFATGLRCLVLGFWALWRLIAYSNNPASITGEGAKMALTLIPLLLFAAAFTARAFWMDYRESWMDTQDKGC